MKCEIERMEINYTFYFFAFLRKMIKKLLTFCYWCGKRAQCNTRYADGKIVREGAQIMLGSNESYVALCRKHYKEGKLWK
jgi:thymidine kinase